MTFEIVKGDLFDPAFEFEALAQGVNTKGKMGAGIAVLFRQRYPAMYEEYRKLCEDYTDILPGLLHTYIPLHKHRLISAHDDIEQVWEAYKDEPIVFNMFSQDWPGPHGSYEWLTSSALLMRMQAEALKLQAVGLPWIGCGIAKLEKHNVQHFFERILGPSNVKFTLVEQ